MYRNKEKEQNMKDYERKYTLISVIKMLVIYE
jgi:hypothetical protein